MPGWSFAFIIVIIAIALAFDFTNGLHDSANSVATIVSTRVLSPKQAVIWAAFFNFVAFLIFGTAVAATIGKGLIDITIVDPLVIFGALVGAIGWNILTWYLGLPSSSSHSLIGAYMGAAVAKAGFKVVILWRLGEDHCLHCPRAPARTRFWVAPQGGHHLARL